MGCGSPARRSLAALLWLMAPPAPASGLGATLGASSDNVTRGVSESGGDPALQAGVHHAWTSGAIAGLRAASAKPRTPTGPRDTLELDGYAGFGFSPAAAWDARVTLIHYALPWSTLRRRSYDELAVSATWLGRASLSVAASPNRPGAGNSRRAAYDYELALRWPLSGRLSIDAGLGYYDLRKVSGTAYAYWSAGVAYSERPVSLALSWIGADEHARAAYGDLAENRAVASVLWTF